jgi:NAD(P)-dependent dehydrogenase (short-subunit alcohol dehydrogenase family)
VKVVLVTGARGGIGSATAASFGEAGFEVVGADLAPGADVEVDLTTADGVRAAVDAAVERHGRLDVVVAAHGISGRRLGDGPVAACTEEAWDAVLDTNLRSVFLLLKQAVPRLVEARGAFVAVGSVLGLVGGDDDFAAHAYAASKAGLIGLVRAVAATYAKDGVRASVVAPSLIATPMSVRSQDDPGIRARLGELQPLTGQFGRPEDVAQAAVYLAQAEFVTGTVLVVDGGWTVR